jgi:hypothetical protein
MKAHDQVLNDGAVLIGKACKHHGFRKPLGTLKVLTGLLLSAFWLGGFRLKR